MRMWMVNANMLCRKHLLGEHVECHMLVGCLTKGNNIKGYIDNGLIELSNLIKRHNALVKEMKKRGYNHQTPLHFELSKDQTTVAMLLAHVDKEKSLLELLNRCPECRKRFEGIEKRIKKGK